MNKFVLSILVGLLLSFSVFGQTDVPELVNSSRRAVFQKNYEKALEKINEAIALEPNNPDLYISRADIYRLLKDPVAVRQNVRTALSLDPNKLASFESGARVLRADGQFEEAIKIADTLIFRNWHPRLGYRIRYPNRFDLGDYVGTMEDIIRAGDVILSEDPPYHFLLKTLEKLKDDPKIHIYYDQLFEILEKRRRIGVFTGASYLALFMAERDLIKNAAAFYFEKGEEDKAGALLERLITMEPTDNGYAHRADVYQKIGRFEAAIADLTGAIELADMERKKYLDKSDSDDILRTVRWFEEKMAEYLVRRGDLYILTEDFEKAVSDFEEAIKLSEGRQ